MGQALSSETHSISGGDGYKYWVGLQMKVQYRGRKKTVYKGILLGSGPRWGERVVVKAFTNLPGTKVNWKYEVVKADATKQMASMFNHQCQGEAIVRIIIPGLVQMDKVSKVNKWLEGRQGNRSICSDDWVSVEEHIPGKVKRYCPFNAIHDPREACQSNCLEAFSHFTFLHSQGRLVACDFQGVLDQEGSSPTYVITDTIIHSLGKEYGPFDLGEEGINQFFKLHKCSAICRNWQVPTPLTPPPPFSSLSLTPPPAFEDIVFPFPRHTERPRASSFRGLSTSSRRRHATGDEQGLISSANNFSSSNSLVVPQDTNSEHGDLSRERSYSSSSRLQRLRFQSERINVRDHSPPSLVPSAPPMYEDCVNKSET